MLRSCFLSIPTPVETGGIFHATGFLRGDESSNVGSKSRKTRLVHSVSSIQIGRPVGGLNLSLQSMYALETALIRPPTMIYSLNITIFKDELADVE